MERLAAGAYRFDYLLNRQDHEEVLVQLRGGRIARWGDCQTESAPSFEELSAATGFRDPRTGRHRVPRKLRARDRWGVRAARPARDFHLRWIWIQEFQGVVFGTRRPPTTPS
jgi:hypothetical protein